MQLELIKKCGWKKVVVNVLGKNKTLLRQEQVKFINSSTFIEFDLKSDMYFYLSNEKGYKTETIIISKNTNKMYLEYNRKKKKYYLYLTDDDNLYNETISYILEDEKNLYFRNDKAKKIDIIIPKNYDSKRKYGLLIMFDGQNLFDKNNTGNYTDKNDPYGSWQIDVSMSMLAKTLKKEFIVVGIEHTDILRTNELITPESFGKLKNDDLIEEREKKGYIDYLDAFINETLLPYITSKYSIDLNNIGISGSSMGGLGCHYIGLKNLGKYKFILCYTPASALIEDKAWVKFYKQLDFKNNLEKLPLFYFFQGRNDDLEELLYQGNIDLIKNLVKSGYSKKMIKSYIEESAMHNEVAWRYAFNYMIYETLK